MSSGMRCVRGHKELRGSGWGLASLPLSGHDEGGGLDVESLGQLSYCTGLGHALTTLKA